MKTEQSVPKVLINPVNCYTKSGFARKIGKSATWVNQLIEQGKLTEIKIQGGSFVTDEPIEKTN